MDDLLAYLLHLLRTVPYPTAFGGLLLENIVLFAMACLGGEWLRRRLGYPKLARPRMEDWTETAMAASCVVLNSVVTLVGLVLWRGGAIVVHDSTVSQALVDCLVLTLGMDACMYVLHRLAHHPRLYGWFHSTHHRFETTRPLTLFALHPFEVLAFGSLWLTVLLLYSPCWAGMSAYLALNLIFGTIGHLGFEFLPSWWVDHPVLRYVSTATFHMQHHERREVNMGFYTVIWDCLGHTLAPDYRTRFLQRN